MAVINIHAGHNPANRVACGAVGILNESAEARAVKDVALNVLRSAGHTVYDCTCENGTSQNDVLGKIVTKCNAHAADIDISIHFNCGRNDYVGDGSIGGTEVFVHNIKPSNGIAIAYAKSVVESIAGLGFRIRDDAIPDHIKENSSLYVLRNTKAPAILVECCFVDDADDAKLYNAKKIGEAIAKGVMAIAGGKVKKESKTSTTTSAPQPAAPSLKHKVGETVSFDAIYTTSASFDAKKPKKTSGVITRVLPGKANPYLINNGMGWTNDAHIINYAPAPAANICYPAYTGGSNSITQALKAMGIDSSMAFRKKIASVNGIAGYAGTYTQNVTMLTLLKKGTLRKA